MTVTAEGPIVDTKTSTIDSKIDQDLLEKLPTSRDAFLDLALTTPGMAPGSGAPSQTTEFQSPTAYSSATNENVFLINGVDATNPRAGAFGSLVNVNYDAVEEVRIVALGSRAEYGSFSGAAIDVVTKSGSNDFHGSVAFYSKLGSVASNQPAAGEDLGAPFLHVNEGDILAGEIKTDWEGSGTVGGPIVKDKLWFFGSFNYLRGTSVPPLRRSTASPGDATPTSSSPPRPSPTTAPSSPTTTRTTTATAGAGAHQPGWDTSMTYGSKTKNNTVSAQWQWFSNSKTTLSAKWLGFWTDDTPYIPTDAPSHPGYINWWKWTDAYGSFGINGAFPYVEAYQSSRNTLQADFSHYAEGFLGEHDLKFGVQYTKGRSNSQGGYFQNYVNFLYPYRWTQSVQYMQSWYGDTGLMFYNQKDTINPSLTVRTGDSRGAFFDDQWSPTKRLTINLGLRFDHMSAKYGAGKVYDFAASPEDFGNLSVLRDRAATDNIFDFKTWSPRVGLTYQLTADGKTVARASWGRYYQPLNAESLRRFGPDMPSVSREFQIYSVGPWSSVDTNGDGEIDSWENLAASRRIYGMTPVSEEQQTIDYSWTLNTDPNLKDQHTDQFTLNLERELVKNFSVSATYIYKHSADIYANIPINRVTGQDWEYERIPFTTSAGQNVQLYSVVLKDYDGNGVVDSADVAWIGNNNTSRVQNLPAFDGKTPVRDYHGAQLVFRKRYVRPVAGPGLGRVLELRRHRPPLAPAGLQRREPDVLRRQLAAEPQLHDQQPRGPAALHARVGDQAVRLLHDSEDRRRPGRPAPVHDRAADVDAGQLSPAHPVRRSAGRRHRPRRAEPGRGHRSQQPGPPPRSEPPRSPRREGLQAGRRQAAESRRRRVQHLQHQYGHRHEHQLGGVRPDHEHPPGPAVPYGRTLPVLTPIDVETAPDGHAPSGPFVATAAAPATAASVLVGDRSRARELGVLPSQVRLPEPRVDGREQVVHLELEDGAAGVPQAEGPLGILASGLVSLERQVQLAPLVVDTPAPREAGPPRGRGVTGFPRGASA